jgi:hypothetical protein
LKRWTAFKGRMLSWTRKFETSWGLRLPSGNTFVPRRYVRLK